MLLAVVNEDGDRLVLEGSTVPLALVLEEHGEGVAAEGC
jgi:hypothetical protein